MVHIPATPEIAIEPEAAVSVTAQLIAQIKQALDTGRARPGDELPAPRQLAADLSIGTEVVAEAFRRLELESVIRTDRDGRRFLHPVFWNEAAGEN